MKRLIISAVLLLGCSALLSAQKITFMPQWTAQAQFIGYYVAKDKGFYEEEGLDVEIKHVPLATRRNAISFIRSGGVQFITSQLLIAMMAADGGLDLVNVLQTSQSNGLAFVANKPVSKFEDLEGMKVGRWNSGFGENALIAAEEKGVSIQWIPCAHGVNLFLSGALDATLVYSYNELISVFLATGEYDQSKILSFSDTEYNFPEDGLYCLGDYYDNNKETVEKFVRASKRGWSYAAENQEDALQICLKYMREDNIASNIVHQKYMLQEIIKLSKDKNGETSFAPVSREVFQRMQDKAINAGLIIYPIEYEHMIKQ